MADYFSLVFKLTSNVPVYSSGKSHYTCSAEPRYQDACQRILWVEGWQVLRWGKKKLHLFLDCWGVSPISLTLLLSLPLSFPPLPLFFFPSPPLFPIPPLPFSLFSSPHLLLLLIFLFSSLATCLLSPYRMKGKPLFCNNAIISLGLFHLFFSHLASSPQPHVTCSSKRTLLFPEEMLHLLTWNSCLSASSTHTTRPSSTTELLWNPITVLIIFAFAVIKHFNESNWRKKKVILNYSSRDSIYHSSWCGERNKKLGDHISLHRKQDNRN